MAFKFLAFVALVATARAGFIGAPVAKVAYAAQPVAYSAPAHYAAAPVAYTAPAHYAAAPLAYAAPVAKVVKTVDTEYDPNPQYSYAYDVQDSLTGDSKSQHETRDGDVVHGSYSLVEADGTKRIVEYTADDVNGFNAVVHKEPAHVAVKAAVAAPVAYAAPAHVAYSAPLAHTKVVAPLSYASNAYYH